MEKGLVASDLENYEKNFLFFQTQINSLRKKYPNQFVAMHDKEIIFGDSIKEVAEKLNKRGIEPSGTIIEFVSEKEPIMIL